MAFPLSADSGIGEPVSDIRKHIARERKHGAENQVPHDQRIVPRHDCGVEKLSQAGQGKDGFNDDTAPDKAGHGEAEQGNDREERIAQGMSENNHACG